MREMGWGIGILLVLAGCVQSEVVVLKDPVTGAIKECNNNSGASLFPIAQTMIDNSAVHKGAAGYQAAGYIRMN